MARLVAVVPHTHWDREWYVPFQDFHMRLVEVLDQFLPQLESDSGYDRFLLDGQMAVVDDYLELRPDAIDRLRRLAEGGRLTVGPWYVLMDEFLVSGETVVRNLQLGLERAEALGGAMPIGYLPDMFGHVAQMPQLLRLAGFDHAVVWRGVPASVDRSAFWWQAPDGSTVRAEYLLEGYGTGSAIPADATALVRRVAAHETATASFDLAPDSTMLWMNGTDHQAPQPWLGQVLAAANESQDRYRFEVTSLPEYLAKAPTDGLGPWRGELRSGARANLLMGVGSNRVDVKIATARTERALERLAEPLCALWLPPHVWPTAELALAWRQVIRNSAHDSICACSHDLVATAVLDRSAQALTIAEGLQRKALRAAAAVLPVAGPAVLNPSARARSGVVEMTVAGEAPVEGAQVLEAVPAGVMEVTGTGAMFEALLARLEMEGFRPDEAGRLVLEAGGQAGVSLLSVSGPDQERTPEAGSVMAEAGAQARAHRDLPLRIRSVRSGWQRVAVYVTDVPGYGWAAWEPGPLTVAPVTVTAMGPAEEPGVLGNGLVQVAVDTGNGTWSITPRDEGPGRATLAGLGRLVDDGDGGDTYNYAPPRVDQVVDRPESVSVAVVEQGPVRGILRITCHHVWPARLEDGVRTGHERVAVVTDLELRAGEDVVRVSTSFDNRSRDHRVRAWFPLPTPAQRSRAECAFAVVERGLEAEGGPHEHPLPTLPSRRFVSAGGLTVAHEGLLEYELVAGGTVLALTLLRATGMLSRPVTSYRDNSAGPAMPLQGPQMQGPLSVRYALQRASRDESDPYRLADDVWVPLQVVTGAGAINGPGHWPPGPARPGHWPPGPAGPGHWPPGPARPARGSVLDVAGAEVSALQRVDGHLEVRVFNPSDVETTVTVGAGTGTGSRGLGGWLVDLRGVRQERFEGSFTLRPCGIATARLDDYPSPPAVR